MTNYRLGADFERAVRAALVADGYDVLVVDRFFAKVQVNNDGCWLWTAARNRQGYGRFSPSPGDDWLAHRWLFTAVHGDPGHLVMDHLCRMPACVNPNHLEAVTHAENCRRGIAGEVNRQRMLSRSHCARGHEWTLANTKQTPRQRKCRTCIREDSARARARRAAA